MTFFDTADFSPVAPPNARFASTVLSWSRPSGTAAYSDGDVIGPTVATAQTGRIYAVPGMAGQIVTAQLFTTDPAAIDYDLWLFEHEPSGWADNAEFLPVAADLPYIIGRIPFLGAERIRMGAAGITYIDAAKGTDVDVSTFCRPYATLGGNLFAALVARTAIATSVTLAKFWVRLGMERQV